MTALDLHDVGEFPPIPRAVAEYAVLALARRDDDRVWPFPQPTDVLDRIADATSRTDLHREVTLAMFFAAGMTHGSRSSIPAFVDAVRQRYQARLIELDEVTIAQANVRAEMQAFDREVMRVMREQHVSLPTARGVAHANAEVARRVAERKAVA